MGLKEREIFGRLVAFLTDRGYEIVEMHLGKKRGPDLIAEKSGKELIVEIKGDTAALDVDLGTAIWQLMCHMRDDTREYALALTPSYRRYVKAIQYPLGKLNVDVYIVSERGVEQL